MELRSKSLLLTGMVVVAGAATVFVDSTPIYTYIYRGNPFTTISGALSCPPESNITGSFTLSSPLGDNLSLTPIEPLSYTFTSGAGPIDSAYCPTLIAQFLISTNAQGVIEDWDISLYDPAYYISSYSLLGNESADAACIYTPAFDCPVAYAANRGDPGTWSVSLPPPPRVSEPSSLYLLSVGSFGLLGLSVKKFFPN